jgi:hypothetical protein
MALTKISRSLLDTGISDSSDATAITIDSNEKIIIGDTASHVDDLLQIETPASGGGHGIQIRRNDSNTDQGIGRILFGNNTDTDLATISAKTDGANDSGAIQFSTQATGGSSSERMRIDSSGNVGIGTSSPSTDVEIKRAADAQLRITSGASNDAYLSFENAGTVNHYFKQDNTGVFQIYYLGGGSGVERFRIDTDGGVGIGNPTATNYALEVEGAQIGRGSVYFHTTMPLSDATYDLGHGSYRWRNFYYSGSFNPSDKNEKNTITNSDLGLDFINRLSPVSYKYNNGTSGRTHYGLLAQDVESVLSDISKTGQDFAGWAKVEPSEAPKHEENPVTDTRYFLNYSEFIAPMIKAIQEQQTQIEALQSEINTLKGE